MAKANYLSKLSMASSNSFITKTFKSSKFWSQPADVTLDLGMQAASSKQEQIKYMTPVTLPYTEFLVKFVRWFLFSLTPSSSRQQSTIHACRWKLNLFPISSREKQPDPREFPFILTTWQLDWNQRSGKGDYHTGLRWGGLWEGRDFWSFV